MIDGKTFLSTTVAGDITPSGAPDVGLFHDDTRFLSRLELKIGGQRAVVLSSSTEKTFASRIELTTGSIALRDSLDLPENTVHIRREQLLAGNVLFDKLALENFHLTPIELVVEIAFDADFVDVFQVRGCVRQRHGHYFQPLVGKDFLIFPYRGLDEIERHTQIRFSPPPNEIRDRVVRWELKLQPLKKLDLGFTVVAHVGELRKRRTAAEPDFFSSLRQRREAFSAWEQSSTQFKSNNEVFDEALLTAVGDFHALQIPEGRERIIAAGIPWFATIFGRDSIIAAYQSLPLNPKLAVDTLRVLARYQGTRNNEWQDEQPANSSTLPAKWRMPRNSENCGRKFGAIRPSP